MMMMMMMMISQVEAALTELDKLPHQHHFTRGGNERQTGRERDSWKERQRGEELKQECVKRQFRLRHKGLFFKVENLIRLMELLDADLQTKRPYKCTVLTPSMV